jgi:methionyl-tRNA formyltransferase
MNILYVSRPFNRSGYYILERLLKTRGHQVKAVLIPKQASPSLFDSRPLAPLAEAFYKLETRYYRCPPLRFTGSIKRLCAAHDTPLFELKTLKSDESYNLVKSLGCDFLVLGGGWPELLQKRIFSLFSLGAINTHPSLLPEFRGTDIHRWQVFHGVNKSGVTIHYIDETFDTGEILGQAAVSITPDDTPQELFEKTARASAPLMDEVLTAIEAAAPAKAKGTAQVGREDASRYHSRWRWEDSKFLRLDWTEEASTLARFVKACSQESYKYGGPFFQIADRSYIVRAAKALEAKASSSLPGQVVAATNEGIQVACGKGCLLIEQIQPDGPYRQWSRATPVRKWAKTTRLTVGTILS